MMIWYDIYDMFIVTEVPPGDGGQQTYSRMGKGQLYIQKNTQNSTKVEHKIDNKHTKRKINIKRISNNTSRIIRKQKNISR